MVDATAALHICAPCYCTHVQASSEKMRGPWESQGPLGYGSNKEGTVTTAALLWLREAPSSLRLQAESGQ
jgi:hypothetical protein